MAFNSKIVLFAGPLILLLLVGVAGYAYSNIEFLSLPIPKALVWLTAFLPIINGFTTREISTLLQRASNNFTLPIAALVWLQIIYETAVAMLALVHIFPPAALACGLNAKWLDLYRSKNVDAIKGIQDKFQCCGLNTVSHMAWPFGEPSNCAELFHRTQSCLGPWREAEQMNAGLLFLVAIVVFILKVLSITSLLTNHSWARSRLNQPFKAIASASDEEDPEDDSRATMRRLIEDSVADGEYRDELSRARQEQSTENTNENEARGPRVVVSGLTEGGNAWRDEGQAR